MRYVLATMFLFIGSCASNDPVSDEQGPIPVPYGYYMFCQNTPESVLCKQPEEDQQDVDEEN